MGVEEAKSAELAGLTATLTQQVNGAKQAALARIGSAEIAGVSAVQASARAGMDQDSRTADQGVTTRKTTGHHCRIRNPRFHRAGR